MSRPTRYTLCKKSSGTFSTRSVSNLVKKVRLVVICFQPEQCKVSLSKWLDVDGILWVQAPPNHWSPSKLDKTGISSPFLWSKPTQVVFWSYSSRHYQDFEVHINHPPQLLPGVGPAGQNIWPRQTDSSAMADVRCCGSIHDTSQASCAHAIMGLL